MNEVILICFNFVLTRERIGIIELNFKFAQKIRILGQISPICKVLYVLFTTSFTSVPWRGIFTAEIARSISSGVGSQFLIIWQPCNAAIPTRPVEQQFKCGMRRMGSSCMQQ